MSMFYELMMRKKEEIMYATIKGTLTENDGVFSGFSASNYLVLQDDITEIPTDFEIQTRISIPATNSGYAIHFLSYSGDSSGIRVFTSGRLNFHVRNNDKTIVEITGTTVLSINTFYFVKIKKVGNTITLYSSTDNITWKTEGTTTTTSTIPLTSKIGFGHCGNPNNNNYIFNGSIDLNNSYIKIGSTKYKLQAVVGYTIVGSPTITDGVVSGLVNQTNYLQLSSLTVEQIGTDSEFVAYCNSGNQVFPLFCANSNDVLWVYIRQASVRVKIGDVAYYGFSTTGIDYTQNHKIKLVFKNYKCSLFIDDVFVESYQFSTPTNLSGSRNIYLGSENYNLSSGTAFTGATIDLNNTYIKINNKLWFNGQQA